MIRMTNTPMIIETSKDCADPGPEAGPGAMKRAGLGAMKRAGPGDCGAIKLIGEEDGGDDDCDKRFLADIGK